MARPDGEDDRGVVVFILGILAGAGVAMWVMPPS
jgi:hypothetical protein